MTKQKNLEVKEGYISLTELREMLEKANIARIEDEKYLMQDYELIVSVKIGHKLMNYIMRRDND